MIEGIEFSRAGDRLTDFEIGLLSRSLHDSPWVQVAKRLIQDLGLPAAGIALAAVLDELGSEKVYVTPRRAFFERLWGIERDELICSLATRPDWNFADIARALSVSREYVRKVVTARAQLRGPTKRTPRGRHASHD